ncbi:MAG: hypothetical protein ACOC95_09980 [Planctomycetota bacterium]
MLIHSELGIIELGTAALYLVGAALALHMVVRYRRWAPRRYLALYVLASLMAVFVCLEEINYGQHLIGFETPELLREHSTKAEFNLHNLAGNVPARRLNLLGTLGFALWCLVLPIVGHYRRWWWPGRPSWFLLPRFELALVAMVAQSMSWLDDLFALCGWPPNTWSRATEFKELYWSLGWVLLVLVVRGRLEARRRALAEAAPDDGAGDKGAEDREERRELSA